MAFAGPGIGLPYPQNPFPTTVVGVSAMVWSNEIYMAAGARFMLPPGWWAICATQVATVVQFLDPVRQMWVPVTTGVITALARNMKRLTSTTTSAPAMHSPNIPPSACAAVAPAAMADPATEMMGAMNVKLVP